MTIVRLFEVDTNKNLTELEGNDWGESELDSYMVQSCYKLRYKPLKYFEIEDLRMMVEQDIGLKYLMPISIETLEADPLSAGKQFKGDLLCSVLCADPEFYKRNQALRKQVEQVVETVNKAKGRLTPVELERFEQEFNMALEAFSTEY